MTVDLNFKRGKILNFLYYTLKPYIPRKVQIALRRYLVNSKINKCKDIWPINETSGKTPPDWRGWPDGKQFALVLTHDVETAIGQEKCHRLASLEKGLGFRSSFNFVPKRYEVSSDLRMFLTDNGFEVGVHGLYHDGKYFRSRDAFNRRAKEINTYIKEWNATGFRSPSTLRRLEWMHELVIEYDSSTFDTDPFEPDPEGMGTVFPFCVRNEETKRQYVELPYTMPQDFTLFVMLREKDNSIWKRKLDWIVEKSGMILMLTHPDYMSFDAVPGGDEEYPSAHYLEILEYLKSRYEGRYWHVLPREMARYWKDYYCDRAYFFSAGKS